MRYRIITMPRTKATYLMKAIVSANNPQQWKVDADYYNEPYNERPDPESAIHWMKSDHNAVIKHHIRHLVADDVYNSGELFKQECKLEWTNVVILRRNLFDATISYARSRTLNEWHNYTNTNTYIEPQMFTNCLLALWGSLVHIARNKHGLEYHKIIFSDDVTGDPTQDIKQIMPDYNGDLQVDSKPSPRNTVENLDQLYELSKTILLPQPDDVSIQMDGLFVSRLF